MSRDENNRVSAQLSIAQLNASERGRGAGLALGQFLQDPDTIGLDFENQAALENLLRCAIQTPSLRSEILREFTRGARLEVHDR